MSFGDLKVQDLIYEDASNNEITVVIADLATKANPTFTGTVTVPTATAGDNSTKAASTAFVVASFAPKASPTFTGTINGADLVLSGNLTVNGTTTTINTQTLDVEDKNVVIGKVSSPSDTTADGGGLTLLGATNKTWNWVNATDAWTSSEHIHLGDNKKLLIGTGSDLSIYHDGSDSYIKDDGTGRLRVLCSDFFVTNAADGEAKLKAHDNGAVELYHDNVKKYETSAAGSKFTGGVSQVATAMGALELDLNTSNYFTKTISGNSTFTFANPAASGTVSIFMLELTHSSGTVTWPGTVKWNADTAPTLTTGKTHLFMFVTDDNGSRYRGSALVDYVN